MKKLVIPAILTATVLIAGMFAFMPVEKASTVHTSIGQTANVLTATKTLPLAGTPVTFTISCASDCLVQAVWLDNTPTTGAENDHELASVTVGGSAFKDGETPFTIANGDKEEARDLLGLLSDASNGQDFTIPLNGGQTAVFTLDTANGANDVIVTMTVAVTGLGAGTATLT